MKTKLYAGLVAGLLFLSTNLKAQVLANWTFEVSQPESGGNIDPEIGGGALSVHHTSSATTYSSPVGNGSNHSYLSVGWVVGDYYQIHLNTSGFANLTLSFDMTGSNKGPGSFELQSSVAGSTFTTLSGTAISVTNVAWTSSVVRNNTFFSFTLPANLCNQPDITLRIVMNSNVAIDGTTVQPLGTNRIDNLQLSTPVPVPIYFKDFTLNNKGVQNELKWTTGHESNLEHFIIEASENGSDFMEVTKIKPYNDASGGSYVYMDASAKNKQYYRIKSVDKNGAIAQTQILAVSARNLNGRSLQCVYNNAENSLCITTDGGYNAMNYSIVNTAGAVVLQRSNVQVKEGMTTVNMPDLTAGLYVVKCEYGGKVYSFKIVK